MVESLIRASDWNSRGMAIITKEARESCFELPGENRGTICGWVIRLCLVDRPGGSADHSR